MERLTRHRVYFDGQHGYKALGYGTIEQRPFIGIIKKLAEYEDAGLTPEEIKALSKQVEDAIKAIGNLQLLVIKKQQENEKARADAWYMMEKWSDAKDKLDEYHKGEAAVEGGAPADQ
jgi:quinol monooxygenase YgiN